MFLITYSLIKENYKITHYPSSKFIRNFFCSGSLKMSQHEEKTFSAKFFSVCVFPCTLFTHDNLRMESPKIFAEVPKRLNFQSEEVIKFWAL